ncbi:MAG: glycerate kinase [Rhodobiaceae bacterium]|nr:glycerate kinase [Rhodobiaceae bacterium]MCC0057217.1 glycerate kinase [Rhodobiaceae bacterium]
MNSERETLLALLDTAIAAADPTHCLPPNLPPPPKGRLIVLAAGKAAGKMAAITAAHYATLGLAPGQMTGLAVTRHGHGMPAGNLPVIEAGHPVPDAAGLGATQSALALAEGAGPDDLVLVLLSGGGSANWIAPAAGIDLPAKQRLTRALLAAGATIDEFNCVRRHLSAIKGGRLAAAAAPARVLTLAISDVPGDRPETIASGPTVPDPTSLADARAILERYRIREPAAERALSDPANETPKPGDPIFDRSEFRIIARPADCLRAAAALAGEHAIRPVILGDALEGEAWRMGADQMRDALQSSGQPTVFLSSGEATVTVRGKGRGGPNQEFVLGAAIAADGADNVWVAAADTDGIDGGTGASSDPAGAIADGRTFARAESAGLDPVAILTDNDSTRLFATLGDLIFTGPTLTNVNDFRAILRR